MSNLTFFIALAGLLFFPGPAPAAETERTAALCARHRQALSEAHEEMTVRDIAAATGIKESTLRQLLKGLAKEGDLRGAGGNTTGICDGGQKVGALIGIRALPDLCFGIASGRLARIIHGGVGFWEVS